MKREKLLAAGMLLFIALAWVWFATDNSGNLLPHGSVPVTSVGGWRGEGRASRGLIPLTYFWTNRDDLLHLTPNQDGSLTAVHDYLTSAGALQHDNRPSLQIPAGSRSPHPTPDGSAWIYGKANAASNRDLDVYVLTADGAGRRLPEAFWTQNPVWTPHGKHWLTVRTEGDYLNSLDGTSARKLQTQAISAWPLYVLGVNAQAHIVSTLGNDQFEPPSPFRRANGLHTPTAVLTEFDLNAPTNSPKTWNVPTPPEALRGQIMLSPQADRILWITEKQASGLALWMNRMRLGFTRAYEGDEVIYVSNLDGTGLKQLFSGPVERQRRGVNVMTTRPLTSLQWLPDGKRISFVYKDTLYIAPVD